jgi:hypothetical protein
MKRAMAVFLVCTLCVLGNQLRAANLSDACGDDHAHFDVKTEKNAPAPAPPAAGKAQVVFIERIDAPGCLGCYDFAPRIAVDGSWVGATKGDSYFVLDVAPGAHSVCADWKSLSAAHGKHIGVASFTAEPGQTYFFEAKILAAPEGPSNPPSVRTRWVLVLSQLDNDKGEDRMKNSALATSTPTTPTTPTTPSTPSTPTKQ